MKKTNEIDWDNLPVHPAALMFPMMSEEEIKEMARSIKKPPKGLQQPIILWVDNSEAKNGAEGPFPTYLLDGRNRMAALKLLGYKNPADYSSVSFIRKCAINQVYSLTMGGGGVRVGGAPKWVVETDPYEYVMSANAHRRHLTPEQRRGAIAAYIKARPQVSNRKVAKRLRVSDHTVADIRKEETGSNAQNANLSHLPSERAKAAVEANPNASASEIAKAANVSKKTAQRAKKPEQSVTVKMGDKVIKSSKEDKRQRAELDAKCPGKLDEIAKLLQEMFLSLNTTQARFAVTLLHDEIDRIADDTAAEKQARLNKLSTRIGSMIFGGEGK
jgi:hypothetical protein